MHKTISTLIKASYPIVWLKTHEEPRAESEVLKAVQTLNQKLFIWSITEGLMEYTEAKGLVLFAENLNEPTAFFKYLTSVESKEGVYIVRDPHPFIGTSGAGAKVTRLFRDISNIFKKENKTMIVVSPHPIENLPTDIERDITFIEFDLPKKEDLAIVFDNIIQNIPDTEINSEIRDKVLESAKGLTLNEADNAFAKAIIESTTIVEPKNKKDKKTVIVNFDNISKIVLDEKAEAVKKSGILEYFHTDLTAANIGGLGNLKDWITVRKNSLTQKARDYGLPIPKGALLMGLPGCGKSLSAKVASKILELPLIKLDVGRIFGGLVGKSEENMRKVIQTVEVIGSCVLWIDEIEKAFAGMGGTGSTDGGTSQRVFGTFLTWLEEKKGSIFVIATVNRQAGLPPELLRRFDEIFFVGLPTEKEREEIIEIHLKNKKRNPENFDIKKLSKLCEGFSGAEIEKAIVSAMYNSFDNNEEELNTSYISTSMKNTVPLSKSRKEELDEMIQWAEKNAVNASKFSDKLTSGRQLIFSNN